MKILLVVPCVRTAIEFLPRLYPMPLGLVSIAAYIRQHGFTDITVKDFLVPPKKRHIKPPPSLKGLRTSYIHYGATYEEVDEWAGDNADKFDVIGITSMQVNTAEDGCCKVVKIFKQYTEAPIVVGGYAATTNPEFILSRSKADYVILGEGEIPFLRFLQDFEDGTLPTPRSIYNSEFMQIENLDELPFPAWDLVELEKYPKYHGLKRIVMVTSRGCPYDCKFCSVKCIMGKKVGDKYYPRWRKHSPEYVISQFKWLYNRFGARYFCILDDNFLADIKRAKEILDGIEALGYRDVRFYIEEGIMVRQAAEHPEIIEQLVRMRFEHLAFGLESVSEKTIEYIKKPETVEQFRKAMDTFHRLNYKPNVFYVLGFKTDTIESMLECFMELSRFKISIRVNNLHLLPKTDMWREYVEEGLIDEKTWDYRLSSFYTPDTKNFSFKDIVELKRVLNGVNFGCQNGIDVFRDGLGTIKSKLKKYSIEFGSNSIRIKVKSRYGRVLRPLLSFVKILAYRCGFNSVKKRDKGDIIELVDSLSKLSRVELALKLLLKRKGFLVRKPKVVSLYEYRSH